MPETGGLGSPPSPTAPTGDDDDIPLAYLSRHQSNTTPPSLTYTTPASQAPRAPLVQHSTPSSPSAPETPVVYPVSANIATSEAEDNESRVKIVDKAVSHPSGQTSASEVSFDNLDNLEGALQLHLPAVATPGSTSISTGAAITTASKHGSYGTGITAYSNYKELGPLDDFAQSRTEPCALASLREPSSHEPRTPLQLDHIDDTLSNPLTQTPIRSLWDRITTIPYHTPLSIFLLIASLVYLVYGAVLAHQVYNGDAAQDDDLAKIGPVVTKVAGYQTDYINIAISAGLTIPTALVTMIVERIHLFEYRRSSGVFSNLEEPTWNCHIGRHHPVNYITSGLIFFLGTLAQTAASVVLVDLVESDQRPQDDGTPWNTSVRGSRLSALAVIVHASCLLLLSAWSMWLGSIRASAGSTLLEQLTGEATVADRLDLEPLLGPDIDTYSPANHNNKFRPSSRTLSETFLVPTHPTAPTLFRHSLGLFALMMTLSPVLLGLMLASALRKYGRDEPHITFYRPSFPQDETILPLIVTFPSRWASLPCFLVSSAIFLVYNIIYEVWVLAMQTVAFRADWDLIWWSRRSDAINGDTELEWTGKGMVTLGVFVIGRGVMGLVLSKSFVLSSFVDLHPDYEFRAVGLIAVTGWCILTAGLMLLAIVSFLFFGLILDVAEAYPTLRGFDDARRQLWRMMVGRKAVSHDPGEYDGIRNFGEKSLWIVSGVWRSSKRNGWKYGAIRRPEGMRPGVLGWGPNTDEAVPGRYRWLGSVAFNERCEVMQPEEEHA